MATPSYKLSEIAARLGLQLELKSPEDDIVITGINTLEEAGPSELSFLANPKYASQLAPCIQRTNAGFSSPMVSNSKMARICPQA